MNDESGAGRPTIGTLGRGGAGGGVFPGFGGSEPPAVGTGTAGTAGTASRSDHTHDGVTSFNAAQGVVLYKPVVTVANVAALAALASAAADGHSLGDLAWVQTVQDYFVLCTSAVTTNPMTIIAASGRAGCQWVRLNIPSPTWTTQLAWGVNATTGNDENVGSVASPLKTMAELSRRWNNARLLGSAYTVTLAVDLGATDTNTFTFDFLPGGSLTVQGTPTTLYTGTVTTATNQAAGPTLTENNIADTTIPVSFTASGLLASGIIFKRTNGTAAYWFGLKDLGAKTLRISQPFVAGGTSGLTLANNDTYVAQQLTKIVAQVWNVRNTLNGQSILYSDLDDIGSVHQDIGYQRCTFSSPGSTNFQAGNYNGCCWFQAAAIAGRARGGLAPGMQWCAAKGAGTTLLRWNGVLSPRINTITFQGCEMRFDQAIGEITNGQLTFFDVTSQCLQAVFGSFVAIIGTAVISGNGNTGKIAVAGVLSQIAYQAAALSLAGMTTDANPYTVGGVAGPIANYPPDAKGNGIYITS